MFMILAVENVQVNHTSNNRLKPKLDLKTTYKKQMKCKIKGNLLYAS